MKEKEIYDKPVAEMNNEVNTLSKNIYIYIYNNLTYYFKDESNPIRFNDFNRPFGRRKTKGGAIDLEKAKGNKKKITQI